CLFFFQAEDGIRDFHVTGVQTCALPIYPLSLSRCEPSQRPGTATAAATASSACARAYSAGVKVGAGRCAYHTPPPGAGTHIWVRSEERRVGQDCSLRTSPDQRRTK